MLWNTLIHFVLGVLGRDVFVWSPQAIAGVLGIAAVVQGIDMIGVYRRHNALFLASAAGQNAEEVRAFRQGLKIKLPQLYVLKVLWYSLITLIVATAARALVSGDSGWSAEELRNSQHFFASLAAEEAATALVNREPPPGQHVMLGAEEILAFERTALREARMVSDAVLDKAHASLREHFRKESERGLEALIQSAELGMTSGPSVESVRLQVEGNALLDRWADWLNAHRTEIRIPKR